MDAIPLAPRPTVAHYRSLAGELFEAGGSGDAAVRAWAGTWLAGLARLPRWRTTPGVETAVEREADRLVAVAAQAREESAGWSLATAQLTLARAHGFTGWARFEKHLDALSIETSEAARFEAAADAVVDGDTPRLADLLRADPGLIRARSDRRHNSTLLHYVSANGIENFRQQTPANIVEVTQMLLAAGAEVDAANDDYGGNGTALGLVATSIHPLRAGVQLELMELLVAAGASLDGLPGGWRPQASALANGCPEAAQWLAEQGARSDDE